MIKIREIDEIQEHEKSKPQWSDFRNKRKFLWFPKTINGEMKWFTTASWQEQFVEETDQLALDLGSFDSIIWVWKPVKWL